MEKGFAKKALRIIDVGRLDQRSSKKIDHWPSKENQYENLESRYQGFDRALASVLAAVHRHAGFNEPDKSYRCPAGG
jgi:hypothetical protein